MNVITPDFSQPRPNTGKAPATNGTNLETLTPVRMVNVNIGGLDSKYSADDLFFDTNYRDFLPRLNEEGFSKFIQIVAGSNWTIEGFDIGNKVKVNFHSFKPGINFGKLDGFSFYVNKKFILEKR